MENCIGATFQDVLSKFYSGAKAVEIPMKPRLDFISKFSDEKKKIQNTFEPPAMKTLETHWRLEERLNKVPEDMIVVRGKQSENARQILNYHIMAFHHRTKKVDNQIDALNREIVKQINFTLPGGINKDFEELYQKRMEKPPPKELVERVERVNSNIGSMKSIYDRAQKDIEQGVSAVDQMKLVLNGNIDKIEALLEKLGECTTPEKAREIAQQIFLAVEIVRELKLLLVDQLELLRDYFKVYNEQRTAWAELLIGTRYSLTLDQKKMKLRLRGRAKEIIEKYYASIEKKKVTNEINKNNNVSSSKKKVNNEKETAGTSRSRRSDR